MRIYFLLLFIIIMSQNFLFLMFFTHRAQTWCVLCLKILTEAKNVHFGLGFDVMNLRKTAHDIEVRVKNRCKSCY